MYDPEELNRPCELDAVVIRPGCAPEKVRAPGMYYWDTGHEPNLDWLKATIGCRYVEVVRLPIGDLWIDEEGRLKPEVRVNVGATNVCESQGIAVGPDWFIAGTAVLVGSVQC